MLGDIVPPLVVTALVFVAIKMSFAYVVLDGGRYFSLLDLGGFLFLLAAYGAWLVLNTRYRELTGAVAPATLHEAPESQRGTVNRHELGSARAAGDAPGSWGRAGLRDHGTEIPRQDTAA
jgi:hypothetical protein